MQPDAEAILLAVAALLAGLAFVRYRRVGRWLPQYTTWLTVAVIFVAVVIGLRVLG